MPTPASDGAAAGRDVDISLVIRSSLDVVPTAVASIRAMAIDTLGQTAGEDLIAALTEALNNAVFHAHRGDERLPIEVRVTVDRDVMTIDVIDCGPTPLPDWALTPPDESPYDVADLDNLPESGLGMYIIHKATDAVEYSVGEGRNTLRLIKRRSNRDSD